MRSFPLALLAAAALAATAGSQSLPISDAEVMKVYRSAIDAKVCRFLAANERK